MQKKSFFVRFHFFQNAFSSTNVFQFSLRGVGEGGVNNEGEEKAQYIKR